MHFQRLATFLTVANALLGASAGPLLAKRQGLAEPDSSEASSTTSSAPSAALAVSTMSDGQPTTFEVFRPQSTTANSESPSESPEASVTATPTEKASESTATFSRTGVPADSTSFPRCEDPEARPFCLPLNGSDLFVGASYYVTWNPDFFPLNSTVVVKVQYVNDSSQQVWSSPRTENSWGYVDVRMEKAWMQGYSMFNLSFTALNNDAEGDGKAVAYDGPWITLKNAPSRHLPPSATTKVHKEGLMIGLPVGLGFVLLVVVGLYIGNRKQRTIGLGNIMGRRNRGYGTRKSKRERLGLKTGAIRLEEREVPAHTRGDSLGSLVSDGDDAIRPAPHHNHFRDEMRRQRDGK